MSNDMLGGALAEVAGPFKDLFAKFGGKDGELWLQALKRFLRKENPWEKAEDYASRVAAAITRCGCKLNNTQLWTAVFYQLIFGTLGEGYVLGEPTKSDAAKKRGYWLAEDFDAWLAGPEVKGKGLEAASLVDLCEYGHDNPKVQLETPVLCWRPNQNGDVAELRNADGERLFYVSHRGWNLNFHCRVLLRKVQT